MLLDKKDGVGKKKSGKWIVGYDLNDNWAQISYADLEEGEPETLAMVTGSEQFNIPLVLCKRYGVNQWVYGKEAIALAQDGGGERVDMLLSRARKQEIITLDGEGYEAAALLTLFVKRSLSLLSFILSEHRIAGLMFTVDELDASMVEILSNMSVNLHLKTENIFFQSHVESFYFYVLNQPKELWQHRVLLFDYDNHVMKTFSFACNKKTTPIVTIIDTMTYENMNRKEVALEQLDDIFLEIAKVQCLDHSVSCVYLIGEGYRDEWTKESLRFLCKNRRAFQGNNLFGKGACFALREKLGLTNQEKMYVFLGQDKLKANIGMGVLRRGEDSYYALLDAGVNWFEAKTTCDIILESGNSFSIIITPLNGKEATEINMILEGLPERPNKTTRLHVEVEMVADGHVCVKANDKGFGEIFPSSGGEWVKQFVI